MSHATDSAIGMMDGAYFTSRNDILNFLNDLLDLNLTKIEQTASGAVACQLTEYIFPGSVPMSKVNWAARTQPEYIDNYKLLQKAFNKYKVQRYVDVDKLIRAKYQDNLEFCQWLKAFFDQTAPMMRGGREGYDPVAVRAKGKGGKSVGTNKGGSVKKTSSSARPGVPSTRTAGSGRTGTTATSSRPVRSTATTTSSSRSNAPGGPSNNSSRVSASKENTANSRLPSQSRKVGGSSAPSSSVTAAKTARIEEENRTLKSENTSLKSKYSELERASAEVEMTLQTVESERDFYFEKLRGIEVMLQVYKEREEEKEGSGRVGKVMESIFKVMYATMEDDVVVDDEGNIVGDVPVESSLEQSALINEKVEDNLLREYEEEDLLTSEVDNGDEFGMHEVGVSENAPEDIIPATQFSSDDSDLDDDELLTSGLDDEPITNVVEPEADLSVESEGYKKFLEVVRSDDDDDDFSDDDLLAD
mmetsp:Transcript_3539/g.7735  ORF Transcript_3539/g.7735 Transcript_3539/m.7735 type:complete len:474 (+) Transcript_3539:161-1582(+)